MVHSFHSCNKLSAIQALVTTEPSTTGRLCFKETMSELLALASSDVLDTLENSTSKVPLKYLNLHTKKTTKSPVHPVKTQISPL